VTRNLILIPLLLWLAGCALAPPGEDQGFRAGPADAAAPVLPPPGTPRAVLTLIGQARAAMEAGDPLTAAARLERALRIEPRNPVLWHYMARLRLARNQPKRAAGLAARANSLAHGNRRLQAANWRLIATARDRLGDREGARRAEAEAERLAAGL